MVGHESRQVYARGLCASCYNAARHLVKSGQTTWADLIASGVATPTGAGTLEDLIMRKVRGGKAAKVSVAEAQKFTGGTRVNWNGVEAYISDYDPVNGYTLALLETAQDLPGYVEECELIGKVK